MQTRRSVVWTFCACQEFPTDLYFLLIQFVVNCETYLIKFFLLKFNLLFIKNCIFGNTICRNYNTIMFKGTESAAQLITP